MATDKKAPEPTPPPPPAKAPSPAAAAVAAKKEVSDVHTGPGFHPHRPVRYLKGFISGTVRNTLDNMALWGRKSSWAGAGLGVLIALSGAAAVTMPFLAVVTVGWVGGLALGAVTGGAVGLVTGGIKGVNLERRKVKYAEDLVAHKPTPIRPNAPDYRTDYQDHHSVATNYFIDRVFQQDHEVAQQQREESRGYFQDMVHNSRQGPHEQGL